MILQLSKNLTIEREEAGKPIGDTLFKKSDFALFVDLNNFNILADSFNVVFRVIRKEDNRILDTVGESIAIAPDGRNGEITNAQEVAEYKESKKKLKEDIDAAQEAYKTIREALKPLRQQVDTIREQYQSLSAQLFALEQSENQNPTTAGAANITALQTQIATLKTNQAAAETALDDKQKEASEKEAQLSALRDEQDNLKEVLPDYEKIDKYTDIVGAKIINNKLTADGLIWVKTLPLLGKTVGDYVV